MASREENISKGVRSSFLKRVAERDPATEPTQKQCSKCKTFKSVDEFGRRQWKTKSGVISVIPRPECRPCERQRSQRFKERKIEEGTWDEYAARRIEGQKDSEKRREYQREWIAAKRREQGIEPAAQMRPGPSGWTEGLSVKPIRQFLERLIDNGDVNISQIEWASGVNHRRISGILRSEYRTVTLDVIDRILTGLGYPEEMHFLYPEPEQPGAYAYIEEAAA